MYSIVIRLVVKLSLVIYSYNVVVVVIRLIWWLR